ncbi:integrator complex subunit 4 [Paragonimus westermani]|uniref:Integrator complex subunit 4 n=1 Tax=Paragonimus westermani TaxID=34504 RepID=A0A5J4NDU5_9TREM|nr:integrator complex subunit 4 [Paragonimus westermani]
MLSNESRKPFTSSSHVPSYYHLEEGLLRRLQSQTLSSSCFCSEDASVINEAFGSLSAHVRAKCVDLLAARAGPKLWLRAGYAGDLVLWHTDDGDARVRERAFACLRVWLSPSAEKMAVTQPLTNQQALLHQERLSWSKSNLDAIYYAACRGLSDVELITRHTSLLLLAQLSTTWPHYELTDPPAIGPVSISTLKTSTEPIYLIDDAFARVCTRLHDPGRQVRQLAAKLLSDLAKSVSDDYLIQTLEKTVMSDRQVRQSALDRGPLLLPTNQKNRSDPLTISNRSSSVGSAGIMSAGLSGAIISGLEDDFFEVRCATLSTVTHVASLSTRFASNCQDLLVDMLTDDIQEVRLAAVRALGAVGDQMPLHSEQVAIITSALAEGSGRIRRRLHQLLSRCRLASAPCLISLLDGLLRNLRRYPQDRDSLWRCAASVGRRHPVFVETCLSSLLRTHSWLSGPEPNREDPAYLTVLLLVLNAEPGAPGMPAKFPRHLAATKVRTVAFML